MIMTKTDKVCKLARIFSAIVCSAGCFGMLCNDTTDKWFAHLLTFFSMFIFGFLFYIYFLDPKAGNKKIESIIIGIIYMCQLMCKAITYFCKRAIEFIQLVHKYHKQGDTYIEIFKAAVSAYKEAMSDNDDIAE